MALSPRSFNGNARVGERVAELVRSHGIQTVVETGTFRADTTKEFAKMVPHVITIESNSEFHRSAVASLAGTPNVTALHGNSPEVLKGCLGSVERPALFYLDAHWERYWPILDELRAIRSVGGFEKSVIVIDDFHVPGSSLGHDEYLTAGSALSYQLKRAINKASRVVRGKRVFPLQKLDWAYVETEVLAINPHFKHSYNEDTKGPGRGVVFIYP